MAPDYWPRVPHVNWASVQYRLTEVIRPGIDSAKGKGAAPESRAPFDPVDRNQLFFFAAFAFSISCIILATNLS